MANNFYVLFSIIFTSNKWKSFTGFANLIDEAYIRWVEGPSVKLMKLK